MLEWLSHMENTKPLALVIFFVTFVGIILWVFSGKKRAERLESYKHIPFLDEEEQPEPPAKDAQKDQKHG